MKALLSVMLRGAVVGTVATLLAVGCGDNKDDNDNPGGEAGEGGSGGSGGTKNTTAGTKSDAAGEGGGTTSPVAGAGNEGGNAAGGGEVGGAGPGTGGAGEGGAAGADTGPDPFAEGGAGLGGAAYTGPAIAKFCNSLTFGPEDDQMPTTFRLEIGEGQDMVSFTATTGECAPPDGEACKEIPTGPEVPVKLFDVDGEVPLDDAPATILADQQYVFITDLDESGEEAFPIWNALFVNSKFSCDDVTYDDTL